MNQTILRAHEIRKEAAAKFGGKPGDYSLKIACEMAKNGDKVELEAKSSLSIKGSEKQVKWASEIVKRWLLILDDRLLLEDRPRETESIKLAKEVLLRKMLHAFIIINNRTARTARDVMMVAAAMSNSPETAEKILFG